jgi:hypothetical protein
VCLSKSIGGYGLPLALTLFRPELDAWAPGEHTGTFRGFDPALITGAAALRTYWADDELEKRTAANGEAVAVALGEIADSVPGASARGRGLAQGLEFAQPDVAQKVAAAAFDVGMLVETAGPSDQVVKLMPPLTIDFAELNLGLTLLTEAVVRTVGWALPAAAGPRKSPVPAARLSLVPAQRVIGGDLYQNDRDAIGVGDPHLDQPPGLHRRLPDHGDSRRGQAAVLGADIPDL